MAFQRPRRPRIAGSTARFTRYLSVRQHSRRRARCLDDTSPTPANVAPRRVPPGTHPSTKRRRAAGSALQSQYINISATIATHAAPSTPADAPAATQGKEPTVAIILDAMDAMTATRTEARAPACQGLRPSAGTSSTLHCCQGIDHLPIFLNTLGRQTPDFGLKTIGLPVKPVARIMMTSLSAIFHCSLLIRHERGWSTFCPTPSRVGWT